MRASGREHTLLATAAGLLLILALTGWAGVAVAETKLTLTTWRIEPSTVKENQTAELSIIFVIFLGAYFTIVINTINGVYNVDKSMQRAALSLGAKRGDVFWKVVFPGTLPSIITGATVGMGITWMVLVAAEMIAGRSGIGFLTWESYTAGDIPQSGGGHGEHGSGRRHLQRGDLAAREQPHPMAPSVLEGLEGSGFDF